MKKLFVTILVCCAFACTSPDKMPEDVMNIEQMKPIVWDMMRAGMLVQNQFRLDTATQKKEAVANYQKVFDIHGTTKDAFYHSYQYYLEHPDKHKILLDSVAAYANRQRIDLFKKLHEE
ncbi:DUF4296 domain-containing protein [Panacibacter ginsenosidivorans]|uniref:DUF4296 domain-containing protein n=1 Tax=Panacibacter ginsenosidivorans TaxID=1813871 RepID=A0A5B8V7A8_9BACT|nr:DUF4296 domain-containing protein [Panacibacter ginsenosidivorans]QEC67357.1 DUF4296 domain-containing protein [Panacibacter ginsenosidivorans]